MSQHEQHDARDAGHAPDAEQAAAMAGQFPRQFTEMGHKAVEALTNLQKDLLDTCEEMNRDWFARARSEANLASEFSNRLANCRSIPETASAWEEWMGRQMKLIADGGSRVFTDSQKYMQAGARIWSNGRVGGMT